MDLLTSFGDRNEYYEQEEKAEHVICVCVCVCVLRMKKKQTHGVVNKKLCNTHINKPLVVLLFDVCLRVDNVETLKALFPCNCHL